MSNECPLRLSCVDQDCRKIYKVMVSVLAQLEEFHICMAYKMLKKKSKAETTQCMAKSLVKVRAGGVQGAHYPSLHNARRATKCAVSRDSANS